MELLVLVTNRRDKLDEILSGFVDIGVSGATIIESQGMARQLSEESTAAPVFAKLQELVAGARPESTIVFSVIETQDKLDGAISMVQDKCGDMSEPGSGILFTLPVGRAIGLAKAIGSTQD